MSSCRPPGRQLDFFYSLKFNNMSKKLKTKKDWKKFKKLKKLPIVELSYKLTKQLKKPLDTTKKMAQAVRGLYDKNTFDIREQSVVLMFGNNLTPIGGFKVSKGSKGEVHSDIHFIFQMLYQNGAQRFIFSHNHPQSSYHPSEADLDFTHALKMQSNYLGFDLIDHIVLNKKGQFSFQDQGLL